MREWLISTADALRWLREEVVRRLNAGMNEREILADMSYPPAIFDKPWMAPTYGAPEYIVRDLYREENGWWDRNPTTLHPASEAAAAAAVWSAIDPARVLGRAQELAQAGEAQLALHVIDLIAGGPAGEPLAVEARRLKAELCRTLAQTTSAFVSRSLYRTSANLLDQDATSWTALGEGEGSSWSVIPVSPQVKTGTHSRLSVKNGARPNPILIHPAFMGPGLASQTGVTLPFAGALCLAAAALLPQGEKETAPTMCDQPSPSGEGTCNAAYAALSGAGPI